MTNPIDTSPAQLKHLARSINLLIEMNMRSATNNLEGLGRVSEALYAIAAEKEAQEKQEPVIWAIGYGGKPLCLWEGGNGALLDLEVKRQGGDCQKMALCLAPQHNF